MDLHAVPFSPGRVLGDLPPFLTVEEAAAVLRIGRTAAYLLARRWEDTGGAEGLPVVRLGRSLRVPVQQLERLAAGEVRPKTTPIEEAKLSARHATTASSRHLDQATTSSVAEVS